MSAKSLFPGPRVGEEHIVSGPVRGEFVFLHIASVALNLVLELSPAGGALLKSQLSYSSLWANYYAPARMWLLSQVLGFWGMWVTFI